METDIEGEKTIFDHNETLRVGSAVVSRLSSSSFPFSADIVVVKNIYRYCLLVFNLTYRLSTENTRPTYYGL